jgi:hypothetical protein
MAPAPRFAPTPRIAAPVVQRLHLTQAGINIAEDNQTLKDEYFAAKSAGRSTDQNAIMALQTANGKAWKEANEQGIAEGVLRALSALPVR